VVATVGLLNPAGDSTEASKPAAAGTQSASAPLAKVSPTPQPTTPEPTPQPNFVASSAMIAPSVVRVVASTCRGTGVGTAFWVSESTLVTSFHSVAEAVAVAVVDVSGTAVPATVVGVDAESGIALLEVDSGASGEPVQIASTAPAQGDWVASVGMPSRRSDLRTSVSRVVETNIALSQKGVATAGLAKLSGGLDVGLGGAPVVDSAGSVVGAVFAVPSRDERLVLPAPALQAGIDAAQSSGSPELGNCDLPTGPHSQTQISGDAPAAMVRGLKAYFEGINAGDYVKAYDALGWRYHDADSSLDDFAPGWVSTYDFNIQIQSAENDGEHRAWVTFDSIFAEGKGPGPGLTCARWSLDYRFVRDGDRLEINANKAHDGGSRFYTPC
jgi:hypothetical protein